MSRYFTARFPRLPRASPDGGLYDPLLPSLTVDDHVPIDTGLVNHRGDAILRAPEPMGFHHPRERP